MKRLGMRWAGAPARAALGLTLLLAALAAEHFAVAPLHARSEALAQLATPTRGAAPQAQAPASALADFHAALPRLDTLAEALGGLDAAARQAGVVLRAAEYRLEQPAGSSTLLRYRVALRSGGRYAQLRDFIGQALQSMPYLALDDVQLRRDEASDALQAELRLTLWLRRP